MSFEYPSETVKTITEFLFIGEDAERLPKCDLVIVFGNNFIDGSVDAVEALLKKGKISEDASIILSGKYGSVNAGKGNEARDMYDKAMERGIDPKLFLIEPNATNAYENLEFSLRIINDIGGFDKFEHILFVGMAFMMKRTQMCAKKLGFPTEKIHYYGLVDPNGKNIGADRWWTQDDSRIRVMQELERIGKYAAKGDLSIF